MDSEILLLALPALAKASMQSNELKQTFFILLRYWLASHRERIQKSECKEHDLLIAFPSQQSIEELFSAAQVATENPNEQGAIEMIVARGAISFAPSEWLLRNH